jgi:transcriptional regulator with XRE-family HTH domain
MPDPAVAERFAQNLAHYTEKAKLTQEELAVRSEVHRTHVGELLNGKGLPRLDTLLKLAGALGVSVIDLVDGMEFQPAAQTGEFLFSKPKRKG